jgi:signal transduction histidine kinase
MLLTTKRVAVLTIFLMVCATILLGISGWFWFILYKAASTASTQYSQSDNTWPPLTHQNIRPQPLTAGLLHHMSLVEGVVIGVPFSSSSPLLYRWALGAGIFGLLSLAGAFCTLILYFRMIHHDIQRFERYVYGMTHELKNPITTIGLTCSMLNEASISEQNWTIQARHLNIIEQETLRLKHTVERVLTNASSLFSTLQFNLHQQEVDLVALIHKAHQSLVPQIERAQARVEIQTNEERILVAVDPHHFTNVLINLLDNALKYTENSPYICIMLTAGINQVSISVQDNGIGMTTSEMRNVFQPYYRTATTRHLEVHGFGLGLSYVRAVVLAHQGTIEISSEVRKGTRIVIHFPK